VTLGRDPSERGAALLRLDVAVPADSAAFMEAVTHHALCEQKKDEGQEDHE
jgi:hypothetical protein